MVIKPKTRKALLGLVKKYKPKKLYPGMVEMMIEAAVEVSKRREPEKV
jgi:hypothetical protein